MKQYVSFEAASDSCTPSLWGASFDWRLGVWTEFYLISQIFGIRAVEAMASMEMAQNRGVTASSCTLITWDWSSKSQETGSKTMDRLFNQHSIRFMEPWKTSEVHQISSDVLSRVDVKSDIAPRLGLTTGFPPLSPCHVFVPLPANLRMVLQGSQGWPGLRLTVLHWIWFITMECYYKWIWLFTIYYWNTIMGIIWNYSNISLLPRHTIDGVSMCFIGVWCLMLDSGRAWKPWMPHHMKCRKIGNGGKRAFTV